MSQKGELVAERNGYLQEIRDLAAKAEEENGGRLSEEDVTRSEELMKKAAAATDKIKAERKSALMTTQLGEFLSKADAEDLNEEALAGARAGHRGGMKSLGEYFVKSDEFRNAGEGRHLKGTLAKGAHFQSPALTVPGGLKSLLQTGDGSNTQGGVGLLWDPERLPTVQATWPELKLRNVVTVGETNSDALTYARILREGVAGGSVSNAAGVPEATSAGKVGSGTPAVTPVAAGVKPESAIKIQKVTAPVITIAHWIPATRKALSDAGQLRTLIDNFLRQGIDQEVERQIIGGDESAGEEFDGLLNTEGIQVQAFSQNIMATIRKALTKVRKFGQANAILVSPNTAERIDLLRITTGAYLGAGPFGSAANAVVWRTPVVEVPGMPDSDVLVGDFRTAVLWDREDAQITATDSHEDFFTRNLVAILAEARAAFGVLDPALIVRASVNGTDDVAPATQGA